MITAYKILQETGDTVSVRITYRTVGGFDKNVTKLFRIVGGRLRPTEEKDIEDQIRQNLEGPIFTTAGELFDKNFRATGPITYQMLMEKDPGQMSRISQADDEDYRNVKFTFSRDGVIEKISLDYDGKVIAKDF